MTALPQFLGLLDRLLYLRTLPALERLSPTLLAAIARHARERVFTRGTMLFEPAEPAESVYVVVDGRVMVEREGMGRETLGPGDGVGFLQLLARVDRGLVARALSDTLVLELDWDGLMEVCEQHFSVLHEYMGFLCTRLLHRTHRLLEGTRLGSRRAETAPRARPHDLVERVLLLGDGSAFSSSSVDALVELARHVSEVSVGPGHRFWCRDEPAEHFLLLTFGSVRCTLPDGGTWFADATHVIGMYEALSGERRWNDVTSEGDVAGLEIHVESFLDILEDHFELAVDVTSKLALGLLELGGEPVARG